MIDFKNIQDIWGNDKATGRVFSWLTRIGAAPKAYSRPISWYQMHQCRAIDYLITELNKWAINRKVYGQPNVVSMQLKCQNGFIHTQLNGKWTNTLITPWEIFNAADKQCRE